MLVGLEKKKKERKEVDTTKEVEEIEAAVAGLLDDHPIGQKAEGEKEQEEGSGAGQKKTCRHRLRMATSLISKKRKKINA